MKVIELILGVLFVIVLSVLSILLCYFEIKDEKIRKENIRKMQGEKLN